MRKLAPFLCLAAASAPGEAFADAGHIAQWSPHPYALLILTLGALLYGKGVHTIILRGAFGRVIGARRVACFALGLAFSYAATASPASEWSERLFSTHMAQHLVLMLVCAPLFVSARASQAVLLALAPALNARGLSALLRLSRFVAGPVAVWLCFTGLFLLWHMPSLYGWALRSESGHALEHGSFFIGAYGFWSLVLAPVRGRAPGHGARLLFVGTAALMSGLPGALIALASRPLYQIDSAQAARLGLTPLEDQELAGLVMWIPGGLAYLAAVLGLLAGWIGEAERRALRRAPGAKLSVFLCLLFPMALAGCDDVLPEGSGAEAATVYDTGGNPQRGAEAIAAIGCGACHTIPGVNGANGLVGPPLNRIGRRLYIAGLLRNTPENLEAWLQDPQKIVPGNVMPNMGISKEQSRDIAAYLYTLR
ncbi:MAG: c-type cytochrome [Hyphomicrobiales bacterium]|nr:MAG: c-type cytochrome [Hyphomicrobiales bacterium]